MNPRDARVGPRHLAVLQLRPKHRREQPRADDVLPLAAQRVREDEVPQLRVAFPAARDLRSQRRGRPGVHDVDLAGEFGAAVRLAVAGGNVGRRIDGQPVFRRHQHGTLVALGVELVPDRDGHAEEALARDQPVAGEAADPVLVAHAHVVGGEVDLAARGDQRVAQLRVARAVRDVPLVRRDDLERPVALLEELHLVHDRLRFADQLAALAQQLDDLAPSR